MDEDTAEKAKARRDLRILLVCATVGVVLPLVLFCVVHLRAHP
jgi:hypothetical protein